ncbi:cholinesterase 1 [Strongylocentrotus purpuratus]|uniref:Carboxylic ester hydrolase n=1 Tax=Strongylocentrotus purpuratus TaxID=7668 RepID=A0A7M7N0K0_STRPU|nr:cholinesterase 1 [Strongylocentrotus purpuratus]
MDFYILLSLLFLALMPEVSIADPNVTVAQGMLVGKTVHFTEENFINVNKDFDIYLGVPFAEPPRRFKPPVAKRPWDGPLNVTEFKDACTQLPIFGTIMESMSEDCLYLNVYSPSPKPTNATVMVWIHGGGFTAGTANQYEFYGVPLVAVGDVIVVTINYRLAVFAKFTTKDAEAPGNVGMLDQVAALQWIHDNIEAFGGDKDRITLFGESAGGAAVEYLTLSKRSRGLFNQAIIESGSTVPNWSFDPRPAEMEVQDAKNLGEALGCDTSPSSALIACLETKTANEIINSSLLAYSFCPVSVDGDFLDDEPANLYKNKDFKRCPILTGTNRDEGTLFLIAVFPTDAPNPPRPEVNTSGLDVIIRSLMVTYGITEDILIAAIRQEYTDWTIADNSSANQMPSYIECAGDQGFSCPSDQFARYHAGVGDTVFKYFFTHEPSRSVFEGFPGWFGAGHAEEVTFVFGAPFIEQLSDRDIYMLTDEEKTLSVKMMKSWTNFAKYGDPTSGANPNEGLGSWPSFTVPELSYKEISLDIANNGVGRALKARQCHFWNDYFPKLQKFIASQSMDDLSDWQNEFKNWQSQMTNWQQAYDEYKEAPKCN